MILAFRNRLAAEAAAKLAAQVERTAPVRRPPPPPPQAAERPVELHFAPKVSPALNMKETQPAPKEAEAKLTAERAAHVRRGPPPTPPQAAERPVELHFSPKAKASPTLNTKEIQPAAKSVSPRSQEPD